MQFGAQQGDDAQGRAQAVPTALRGIAILLLHPDGGLGLPRAASCKVLDDPLDLDLGGGGAGVLPG